MSSAVLLWRTSISVVLAAHIVFGPLWEQVLGARPLWWVRSWNLYTDVPTNVCVVRYYRRGSNGDHPVDWHRVLGHSRLERSATIVRRPTAVQEAGRRLCEAIGAQDVRADARCGSPSGWRTAETRSRNLCSSRR